MKIEYKIIFGDSRTEVFDLKFSPSSLLLDPFPVNKQESWIKLEFHQCKVCPLDSSRQEFCPVACNLIFIIRRFQDDLSHTMVLTRVTTAERTIEKKGSLQECLSPLMGLVMATSGCPILGKFKPMVFTHLPFSNEDETLFRSVSTYLLSQYVRMIKGKNPDWHLEQFHSMYSMVREINDAFIERFREIKGKDANINSLLILHLFSELMEYTLAKNWIERIIPFFSEYLED